MIHGRDDHQRFQDPAGHPDVHFYELIGKLAEMCSNDTPADEIALEVGLFFSDETRIDTARAFAARVVLSPGASPIGADEPVFLLRARDACAPGTILAYASLAEIAGAGDVAELAQMFEHEVRRWQSGNGSKVPDLTVEGGVS